MASYGNTVLTSAGLDLAQRNLNGTTSFTITKVATSSEASLVNATISQITGLSTLPSVVQTGTVTAFDTSNPKQVGLKAKFTNDGLAAGYKICAVGVYAKETGKTNEVLYAVAPAIEPEEMPARPDSNTASFNFTLQIYMAVGNPSTVSVTATTEGVVKSINGSIKPDTNGDLALSVGGRNLVLGTQEAKTFFDGTTYANTSDTTLESGYYWPDRQRVVLKKHLSNLGLTYSDTLTVTGTLTISKNGTLSKSDFADAFTVGLFRTTHNWKIHATLSKNDLVDGQTTYKVKETFVIGDSGDEGWPSPSPYFWFSMAPSGYSIRVDHYQVEVGNVATDWTPAPEDFYDSLSSEATARSNGDTSVLSQAKAYTDDAKSDLTAAMTNADNSVLGKANAYTDNAKSDLTTVLNIGDASVLSQAKSYADNAKSGLQLTMAGQRLDLIDGMDGQLVMGYSIPNTTWDGTNACLALPTTPSANGEVLPQNGTAFAMGYNWEAGKTYTQSIIIETDAQINTNVQPQWTWFTMARQHNMQPAELIDLGNHCYRLIGSYTPNSNDAQQALRILDIWNFTSFVNVTTGTYLKFRLPHFFCADDYSLASRFASEATARTNGDNSVLSQSKAYTDATKSDLTAAITKADASVLGQANAYTDNAVRQVWTPTVITTAIDLNNIKACGSYFIQNTLGTTTNTPIPNAWLYVRVEGVPNRLVQTIWKDLNPANQWVRVFADGWSNWTQITKAI